MRIRLVSSLAVALLMPPACAGVQSAPEQRFKVASVKRVLPGNAPPALAWRPPRDHGRYTLRHVPLRVCLQIAYGLMPDRVEAPAWMDSERYDIAATMPADTPDDQVPVMLRNLPEEKFRLKFHWMEKEVPAYVLVVDIKGPAIPTTSDPDATPTFRPSPAGFVAKNHTVADLAGILMRWTDRPVVDETGIAGFYDFKLEWSPNGSSMSAPLPEGAALPAAMAAPANAGSEVLASLGSLGLKAVPRKTSLRFLIVDSAVKEPIE